MKLSRKPRGCLITLIIIVFVLLTCYVNRQPILTATANWLTARTLPFDLLVNPKTVKHNIQPPTVTLKEQPTTHYQTLMNKLNNLNETVNPKTNRLTFLNAQQNRQLAHRVEKKPHRYLYSVTPILIGRDQHDPYVVVSANRYDDTRQIVSYRYRLIYRHHQFTKATYLTQTKNNKPPKFIGFTKHLGNSGISTVSGYLERMNLSIASAGLNNQEAAPLAKYQQLAQNIGLDSASGAAFKQYALNLMGDQKNSAVSAYEITDVPRETNFIITQINRQKKLTYTLTFDRNTNHFIRFRNGIHSQATTA
ncbi:hypothetical protein H3R26_04075 [Lactobacillus sp. W8092]|nr:hypothetical protein [Lactobacillus sp. W8092]